MYVFQIKSKIKNQKSKFSRGLTLAELLITLSILIIVMAVLWAILDPLQQQYKTMDAVSKNTIDQFEQAASRYGTDVGAYPWNQSSCISGPTPTPTLTPIPPTPTPAGIVANMPSGLIHYWQMNGGLNAGETDQITTGSQNLSATATVNTSGGVSSSTVTSRSFPGGNTAANYLSGPATGTIVPSGPFSVSLWMKNSNGAAAQTLFDTKGNGNGAGVTIMEYSNQFFLNVGTNASTVISLAANMTTNDNIWHHVVFTWTGTSAASGVNVYVDCTSTACVPRATGTTTFSAVASNLVHIGNQPNIAGRYYYGSIDEVGVWNKVLSTTEIAQIYNYDIGTLPTSTPIPPTPTPTLAAYVTLPPGTSLSWMNSCIQIMAGKGDIKENFGNVTSDIISNIIVFQPDPNISDNPNTILMCFKPFSRNGRKDPLYKYTSAGLPACDPTTNSCYICMGQ